MIKLIKLDLALEEKMPDEIKLIRRFYFEVLILYRDQEDKP